MTFRFPGLNQAQIDWFLANGVDIMALATPIGAQTAKGIVKNNRFVSDPSGPHWVVFEEPEDLVFWQPRTGELKTLNGRAFALGEDAIVNAGSYAFDGNLNILAEPLAWLARKRDGIVVIDWDRAFDNLRDCPRIAVDEALLPIYRRYMRPGRIPELFILTSNRRLAA